MVCPKHGLTNGHASYKAKQETLKINVEIEMFKLQTSSLTYAITLSSKPKKSNKVFTWYVMATPIMLCTSNFNCHMVALKEIL